MSNGKFQKLNSGSNGGRTMWQIVWDGDEDLAEFDDDVTVVDASNIEFNNEDAEDVMYALDAGDTSLKDELDAAIVKGDELQEEFEDKIERVEKNGYSKIKHQGVSTFDIESAEMEPENTTGEFNGNFLFQKDSDTDLILKLSRRSELSARIKFAWANCRNPLFWRTYWWLPVTIVGVCILYAVIVTTIVFTMRDR